MASQTINGLTITVNADKSVLINGTTTATTSIYFASNVPLLKGVDYILSTHNTGTVSNNVYLNVQDETFTNKVSLNFKNASNASINLDQNTKANVRLYASSGITITNLLFYPMIEFGTTASDYEQHVEEQTQLLSLGSIELAKIGDYTDRIFKDSGKWYVEKNIEKLVLNGTETGWSRIKDYRFNLDGLSTYSKALGIDYMCNYYECFEKAANNSGFDTLVSNVDYGCDLTNASSNTLRIKDTRYTSLDDYKLWLSTHNVNFYYRPLTPTTTEITDTTLISQLENVLKMHTNKNVTNAWIEPSGTNAQGSLDIVYRQDLQTLTDKIETLEARVALLE